MPSPSETWMIYGANGYTGRLIAAEAARRGLRPVLAGRTRAAVEPLAQSLGLEHRVFALDSPHKVADHLAGFRVVAHCAGPFSATAAPMMDACVLASTSYLDITGEIEVIEAGATRHDAARRAGISLMPAVGFDVVPTDCLAATLAHALPGATHLVLAFAGTGSLSPGTTKTMVEGLPHGGRARIEGRIVPVPPAWKSRQIPFRNGPLWAMTIPWGDVASAYYSTGIPNIEVYLATPPSGIRAARRLRYAMPWLGWRPIQAAAKWWIGRRVPGPSPAEAAQSRSSLWGEVRDGGGGCVSATLETIGGYPLTVLTTLAVVERVLAGQGPLGFATPSQAFGQDFILSIPGSDLQFDTAPATIVRGR